MRNPDGNMTASKVTMPVLGFDLGEFEDDETQASEIGSKDWFRPAATSMAKLNQVQAKVYNMGFKDPSSLKPPRSMRKQVPSQQRSARPTDNQLAGGDYSYRTSVRSGSEQIGSYRDLTPDPPLTSSSYQKTAWGSNSSIPDLIAKQKKRTAANRPSSAKVQNHQRSNSASRTRPQSAKDPLCEGDFENVPRVLGVMGEKKDVATKPSVRGLTSNNLGYMPTPEGHIRPYKRAGRATAGPPPGHSLVEPDYDPDVSAHYNTGTSSVKSQRSINSPMVPYSSPVTSDGEDEEAVQEAPQLLRRPLPEPIHLSLPTVNDGDDDNGDDMNTERLLRQADEFVLKKAEEEENCANNLNMANATLPEEEVDEDILSTSSASSSELFQWRERNKTSTSCLPLSGQREVHRKKDNSETKLRTSLDNSGGLSDPNMSNTMNYSFINQDGQQEATEAHRNEYPDETLQSDSRRHQNSKHDSAGKKFLLPDEDVIYQPLEISDMTSKSKARPPLRGSVKFREDQNVTVDITPRNQGRKITTRSSAGIHHRSATDGSGFRDNCGDHGGCFCDAGLSGLGLTIQEKSHNGSYADNMKNRAAKLTKSGVLSTTVMLVYDDQGDETTERKETKSKKKKSKEEVETLVSTLSEEVTDSNNSTVPHKSSGEKNYYELARAHTFQHSKNEGSDHHIVDERGLSSTSVFKTTKTIEFDPEAPQEIVSKSAISSLHKNKSYEELNHKPHRSHAPQLWPSTIKRQQERDSRAKKEKVVEKETDKEGSQVNEGLLKDSGANEMMTKDLDELETMLNEAKSMAHTSLLDATQHRPPTGKKSSTAPKKVRSNSAKKKNPASRPTVKESPMFQPDDSLPQKQKPRPSSAQIRAPSMTDISRSRQAVQALRKDNENKRYSMYSVKPKPTPVRPMRRIKSASSANRPQYETGLTTLKIQDEMETPEKEECREMQNKMAALGVEVNLQALERALYPPSGRSKYYEVEGGLPSDPCAGLLPHYKHWVPEEFKKLQMIKRKLAQDDRIKRMQKLREEKRLKKMASKMKGDTKQLVRRNSVV